MKYRNPKSQCRRSGIIFFAFTIAILDFGFSNAGALCQEVPVGDKSELGNKNTTDVLKEDKYEIDNTHTSVVFAVSHFGLSYTYGRFNECSGTFALVDGGELSQSGFTFALKADSIDTNNDERDRHLRGPDFFDTEQFPEIKFVTTGINKVDDTYQVTGDFTMLDQTRELTLPIRLVGLGNGPFGKHRAGYFTKFTIKRSDFGMNKMLGQVGDKIAVTFSFEGVKK